MRLTDSFVLPSELERARAAGDLVVFAGAGVSMGPPANLPSFVGLARRIAEPKLPCTRSDEKSLDAYLGRAARAGVEVQQRARDLLNVRGSHTPLHRYLLGIFGTAERVRLITTNFDRHFSSAAADVFPGALIPDYVGPALPPGQSFRGIVQLHGALGRTESRLVLTDRDFAEAYMAEGWAARFLVRAFAGRTVLFVGYSLGDPIMRYLLHALPPAGQWFALWRHTEVKQGSEHAITPITFGKKRGRDPYGDLNDGMKRWYWYAQASPTVHDRELRALIAAGPPASLRDEDYLRARLRTPEGLRVFWTTAQGEPWFAWAASEGLLDGLVDPQAPTAEVRPWSQWCLEHFCHGDVPPLLLHLRGRPLTLNPAFRHELVLHLWRRDNRPSTPVLRQLVALLVGDVKDPVREGDVWAWLTGRLIREGHADASLALLRAATRLSLQPLERIYLAFDDEREEGELPTIATKVATLVAAPELVHLLEEDGATLAAMAPASLLALGEQRIDEAYQLLELSFGSEGGGDWLSFARTAIAPSGRDRMARAGDVLVDMVRVVLDHLAATEPHTLVAFANRHQASSRALLRRLSLYALSKCASCSSDELLARATALGSPRDVWVRPELYLFLGAHFPSASEPARRAFIDALRDEAWWGVDFDQHSAHARFSLSVKLQRDAPTSAAAQEFAAAEREAHPRWIEQDSDGFLSRVEMGWGRNEPSPIEVDQLLAWSVSVALEKVRAALSSTASEGRDLALLGALSQAVSTRPPWGIELFVSATAADTATAAVAEAVLSALRNVTVDADGQQMLLAHVSDGCWAQGVTHTLASVLEHWARHLGEGAAPAVLDAFDAAADLIFERSGSATPGIAEDGWTERAINHPAGHAAQIWWHVANARDWVDGRHVVSLDDAEKSRWERVLGSDTAAGAFARPILGMATDRIAMGDFPWATEVVFPAFAPAAGRERAVQLWDGRLMQHRWYWGTVEGLQPYLPIMLEQSATLLPARSEELGELIALLVANVAQSGMSLLQLQRFAEHATAEARRRFAHAVRKQLEGITSDERRRVWRDLLGPYWKDRRTNMPLPLSADELSTMVWWVLALPEVASEAVAALRASPKSHLEHADGILRGLARDDSAWVIAHPAEAVSVIAFLAERQAVDPWMAGDAVDVLESALAFGAPQRDVLEAAELLVSAAPERAAALVDRLRLEPRA